MDFHLNVLNSKALYQSGYLVRELVQDLTLSLQSGKEAARYNWTWREN